MKSTVFAPLIAHRSGLLWSQFHNRRSLMTMFALLLVFGRIQGVTSNESLNNDDVRVCKPNLLAIPSTVTHRPLQQVIAHRGASAHVPEHTVAAYRLALELGADWIEPDIVATRDGQLIALHTVDLAVTTNVADVFDEDRQWFSSFANRTSYWTFNFTLEEIQQLKVKQRLPDARTEMYDNLFGIPTLTDILDVLVEWLQFGPGLLSRAKLLPSFPLRQSQLPSWICNLLWPGLELLPLCTLVYLTIVCFAIPAAPVPWL